jgi:O-antigen ligase
VALIVLLLPTYLIRFSIFGIPFTFLEWMIIIVFLIWLGVMTVNTGWKQIRLPWKWLIAVFLLAATIAIFVSADHRAAWGIWKAYFIEPIMLYLVIVNAVRSTNRRWLVWALGLSALTIAGVALAQYFGWLTSPEPWVSESPKRMTSLFDYPNAVGLYLTPIIAVFMTFLATKKHQWNYFVSGLIVLLGLAGIFFANTRGAILGLGAAMVWLGLTSQRKRLVWLIIGLTVITVLIVPSLRHTTMSIATVKDTSADVRVVLWQGTWNLIKSHPILGAGLAGFPAMYDQYRLVKHTELLLYPHNIFLNFWVEIGLLGLLAFIGLLIATFSQAHKNIQISRSPVLSLGITTALIAIIVYGLVDAPYFKNDLAVQFWVWLGLLNIGHKTK